MTVLTMKTTRSCFPLFSSVALAFSLSCGDGVVDVTNESYEPRIVVSGLLVAGHPVENIHVSRNFRLDENLRETPIFLNEADVLLIDEDASVDYPLTLVDSPSFEDRGFAWLGEAPLVIRAGGTYSLEVRSKVKSCLRRRRQRCPSPASRSSTSSRSALNTGRETRMAK